MNLLLPLLFAIFAVSASLGQWLDEPSIARDEFFDCLKDEPSEWKVGTKYFGNKKYIEYTPGDLPFIISLPHGGSISPSYMPRNPRNISESGVVKVGSALVDYIEEITGKRPHLVVNKLHPMRMNPNRPTSTSFRTLNKDETTHQDTKTAYCEYFAFINRAGKLINDAFGRGHIFDLHTNGHAETKWCEIGFNASPSTVSNIARGSKLSFHSKQRNGYKFLFNQGYTEAEMMHGTYSLGAALVRRGIKSVPSPIHPGPFGKPYFGGGYISGTGSRKNNIAGSQLENYAGSLRFDKDYYWQLAEGLLDFMQVVYGLNLRRNSPHMNFSTLFHATHFNKRCTNKWIKYLNKETNPEACMKACKETEGCKSFYISTISYRCFLMSTCEESKKQSSYMLFHMDELEDACSKEVPGAPNPGPGLPVEMRKTIQPGAKCRFGTRYGFIKTEYLDDPRACLSACKSTEGCRNFYITYNKKCQLFSDKCQVEKNSSYYLWQLDDLEKADRAFEEY